MIYVINGRIPFVKIEYLNRYGDGGAPLCRNTNCPNKPARPYSYYCSEFCSKTFERWYLDNFFWNNVRFNIFKRDNYQCQLCHQTFPKQTFWDSYEYMDCDHIIPRAEWKKLGYIIDEPKELIRAYLEFFHNPNNLRSLCKACHKKVTAEYTRKKFSKPKPIKSKPIKVNPNMSMEDFYRFIKS